MDYSQHRSQVSKLFKLNPLWQTYLNTSFKCLQFLLNNLCLLVDYYESKFVFVLPGVTQKHIVNGKTKKN